MNDSYKTDDKRQHRRYAFENIAYAIVNSEHTLVGHLLDISKGGIAFSYVGSNLIEEMNTTIDIFLYDMDLHIQNIPVSLISNFPLTQASSMSRVTMMRCGTSFSDLSRDQKNHIECIINALAAPRTEVAP